MTRSLTRVSRPLAAILVVASAVVVACQSDLSIGPEGVVSVTVDQTVIALHVGEGIQLNGAARDEAGVAFSGPAITWVSSNQAVARVSSTGLVAAVGIGTATITASVAGETASATVLVTEAPAIGVSSSALAFTAVEGGGNPAAQTIGVSNDGGGALTDLGIGVTVYNAGEPTGWLSAALNGTRDSLALRTAIGALGPGTYQARVPLLSGDAANSPLNVFVTLTVTTAVPAIQLSATFASFTAFGGGAAPAPQTVAITNTGSGSFLGLVVGPVAYAPGQPTGWLSAGLNGSTVTLQATTGSLLAGNYLATVPVTATNASNGPQLIVVGFAVAPTGPAIGVLRPTANFSGAENGPNPAPDSVGIVNLGSGVLDQLVVGTITYGSGQPTGWLSEMLTGTTAPSAVVLNATTAGLPAGAYDATVPIGSPVATNSPVNLTVSLVLSGSDSLRFDPTSGQAAVVGTPVAPDAAVLVVDANGNPVSGRVVTFSASGSGSISQAMAATDGSGRASVMWTLGTVAATNSDTLFASLPGGLTATLVATASAGMATQLLVAAEPGGAVSQAVFGTQPAVQVADAFGNAVGQSGVVVAVARSLGAGILTGSATASTNGSGLATFTGLAFTDTDSLTALGPHRLDFTSGSLGMASSVTFNVDVSFDRNVQLVIQTTVNAAGVCTLCHPTFTARGGLVNVSNLVFNPGCGTLVVPSDTANSILFQKLIVGGNWCGQGRMPQGDTLSTVRQNLIRDWILQGAN